MAAQIITIEDLNAFKVEFFRELKALLKENGHSIDKKWLTGKEFMNKFNIKDRHTLAAKRGVEVEAEKRGGKWYYNAESYLPS